MELFTLTEKKRTAGEKLAAGILLILGIFFILCSYFIIVSFAIGVAFFVAWYFVQFRRFFEFELSYFEGEFKLVKVINKARRKKILFFSMDEVITIAKSGDRSVYKYETDKSIKTYNCYSLEEDALVYDIIVKKENTISLVKVEMEDKMLDEICKKYQQKVVR